LNRFAAANRFNLSEQVFLTGKRLVDRAPDAAQERLIRGIRQLPPARRRTLASTLAELGRVMETADRRPVMFFEEHSPSSRRRVRRA